MLWNLVQSKQGYGVVGATWLGEVMPRKRNMERRVALAKRHRRAVRRIERMALKQQSGVKLEEEREEEDS